MILVRNIRLPLSAGEPQAFEKALHTLRVPRSKVEHTGVAKLSVDARHGQPKLVYTVAVTLRQPGEEAALAARCPDAALHRRADFTLQPGTQPLVHRPVVCGLGPAGLFAALLLARQGYRPIVLERGPALDARVQAVEHFSATGQLDPNANIQFGEGGAGTFSDGKLTTRIGDELCDFVTEVFLQHGAPAEIAWKQKPHVATDTVFKPFEYTDASGNFVGIDVDILAAIAEDQGFEYELKSLGWDAAIAACQSGQADAMIAGASITDERKASGWMFSDGYYDSNQTLTVPEDSDIAGFADLSGKNVAVKTGTQGASYAESLKDEYGFTITYFEDSPTMYQAVLGGQCVGCFEDTPIMKASIKDGALALKVLEDTASDPAPYGFAIFSEDSQELLDMFNKGLADIKANGKYDEILAKYLG